MGRRRTRTSGPRTKLESRIAALEGENASIWAELAALKERLEQGVTGPVALLVHSGRITEARQLVGLLVQTTPTPSLARWSQVLAPPVVHSESQATGSPLARNTEWLRQNAEAHVGKWVVLRDGALVDEDVSRVTLQRRLERTGNLQGVTFVRL